MSQYLNKAVLRIIYLANFESRMRYAIMFYGSGSEAVRVFILQKRVLRKMLHLSYRESCRGHFRANNILTFFAVYIQECLLFIFKNQKLFIRLGCSSSHDTRSVDFLYPKHRYTLTEKSTHYNCIKFFNILPIEPKNIGDLKIFKRKIHELLMKLEPYSIPEYVNM